MLSTSTRSTPLSLQLLSILSTLIQLSCPTLPLSTNSRPAASPEWATAKMRGQCASPQHAKLRPGKLTSETLPSRPCLMARARLRNSVLSLRRSASCVPEVSASSTRSSARTRARATSAPSPPLSSPRPPRSPTSTPLPPPTPTLTLRHPQPACIHPPLGLLAPPGHSASRQAGMEEDTPCPAREVLRERAPPAYLTRSTSSGRSWTSWTPHHRYVALTLTPSPCCKLALTTAHRPASPD